MRTLIVKTEPEQEGIDNTQEIELEHNISWELRFYCDECGKELTQNDLSDHNSTCKELKNETN